MDQSWVPRDACTLPKVEQPLRVAEFDAMFAEAVVAVKRIDPARTRLELTDSPGLESRVAALADRETGCCSFFTFTVSPANEIDASGRDLARVFLDVEVPSQRTDVLAALTRQAESAAQPGSSETPVVGTE